jgi:hypothetical protein
MNFIVKAFVSYLESHPQVVESLVEAAVKYILAELKKLGE